MPLDRRKRPLWLNIEQNLHIANTKKEPDKPEIMNNGGYGPKRIASMLHAPFRLSISKLSVETTYRIIKDINITPIHL